MTTEFAYQASFKTTAGTLLNLRADNGAEFEEMLDGFDGFVSKIAAIESALSAASTVAQGLPLAPAASQPAYTGPAPVGGGQGQAASPTCAHGAMKYVKAGISKATGRPYNAFYACQGPREQQCKTVSV